MMSRIKQLGALMTEEREMAITKEQNLFLNQ